MNGKIQVSRGGLIIGGKIADTHSCGDTRPLEPSSGACRVCAPVSSFIQTISCVPSFIDLLLRNWWQLVDSEKKTSFAYFWVQWAGQLWRIRCDNDAGPRESSSVERELSKTLKLSLIPTCSRVRFLKNKNQQVNWSAGSKLVSRNFGAFDLTFLFFFLWKSWLSRWWGCEQQRTSFFFKVNVELHTLHLLHGLLDHSSTPAPSFSQCVVIEASIVGPQFFFCVCPTLCPCFVYFKLFRPAAHYASRWTAHHLAADDGNFHEPRRLLAAHLSANQLNRRSATYFSINSVWL